MDKQEYIEKLKAIDDDAKKAKAAISKEFAMSNNPVKLGDIISDHASTIVVDHIGLGYSCGMPECVYRGVALTKKLVPKKNGSSEKIWQSNLKMEN
jgi:hypothetical protein